jgi:hypothetical protein
MVNENTKGSPRLRAFSCDKENPPKSPQKAGWADHISARNGTFLEGNKAIETLGPEYAANPRR